MATEGPDVLPKTSGPEEVEVDKHTMMYVDGALQYHAHCMSSSVQVFVDNIREIVHSASQSVANGASASAREDIDMIVRERDLLRQENFDLELHNEEIQQHLNSSSKTHQVQLSEAQKEIARLKQYVSRLEHDISLKDAAQAPYLREVQQLQGEMKGLRDEHARERKELESRSRALVSKLKGTEKQLAQEVAKTAKLRETTSKLQTKMQEMTKELVAEQEQSNACSANALILKESARKDGLKLDHWKDRATKYKKLLDRYMTEMRKETVLLSSSTSEDDALALLRCFRNFPPPPATLDPGAKIAFYFKRACAKGVLGEADIRERSISIDNLETSTLGSTLPSHFALQIPGKVCDLIRSYRETYKTVVDVRERVMNLDNSATNDVLEFARSALCNAQDKYLNGRLESGEMPDMASYRLFLQNLQKTLDERFDHIMSVLRGTSSWLRFEAALQEDTAQVE